MNTIHLQKGTLIDTQTGFVDTFNWLVDFCGNLDADAPIAIENADGYHPVITYDGSNLSSGITVNGTDGTTAVLASGKQLNFTSATDSNVKLNVTGDANGNVTV